MRLVVLVMTSCASLCPVGPLIDIQDGITICERHSGDERFKTECLFVFNLWNAQKKLREKDDLLDLKILIKRLKEERSK